MCHYVNNNNLFEMTESNDEYIDYDDLSQELEFLASFAPFFNTSFEEKVDALETRLKTGIKRLGVRDEDADRACIFIYTTTSTLIAWNILPILRAIYCIVFGFGCLIFSLGTSFAIVAISCRIDPQQYVDFFEMDDEMKRLEFQNSNFDKLYDLIQNDNEPKSSEYLESLSNENMYMTVDMSFHPVQNVVIYYNHKEESFDYYTQTGDLVQNQLNAICRMYCLKHETPELYVDSEDMKYMNETFGKEASGEEESSMKGKTESFVDVDKTSEENEEESGQDSVPDTDESKGWGSIFARPKKHDQNMKSETEQKMKKNDTMNIIKFKKVGLISDLEFDQRQKRINTGNDKVSYQSFLHQMMGKKSDVVQEEGKED